MIGIYALWFEEPSMVYIGQSQNIESRYKEHLKKLKSTRATNYKVQDCYNLYGQPELVILEECFIEQLNHLESIWQKEFNSLVDGLDLIEAGQVGWGTNSSASKYSKIQVLRVFSLLYRTDLRLDIISKKLNVNIGVVQHIKSGKVHLWLKYEYPDQYRKMQHRKKYDYANAETVDLIDPAGIRHRVTNIKAFASLYFDRDSPEWRNFTKGLSKLRTKTRNQYKGWKLLV